MSEILAFTVFGSLLFCAYCIIRMIILKIKGQSTEIYSGKLLISVIVCILSTIAFSRVYMSETYQKADEEKKLVAEKKIEEEKLAAEKKAEQEKMNEEKKAEYQRLLAEAKAKDEKLAAERKAQNEKLAAERKAQNEKLAAEKKAQQKVDERITKINKLMFDPNTDWYMERLEKSGKKSDGSGSFDFMKDRIRIKEIVDYDSNKKLIIFLADNFDEHGNFVSGVYGVISKNVICLFEGYEPVDKWQIYEGRKGFILTSKKNEYLFDVLNK